MNVLYICKIVCLLFLFWNHSTSAQYSEFRIPSNQFYNQDEPSVTSLPSGGYLVSWTTATMGCSKEIAVRYVDSKGNLLSELNPVDNYCGGDQQFSDVAAINSTQYVVVWQSSLGQDGDGYGIYRRICTVGGSCQDANEVRISASGSGNQTAPQVAQIGNSSYHVVVWYFQNSTYEGVYARIFNSVTGNATTAGDILLQASAYAVTSNYGNPDIDGGMAFDGYRFFLTWQYYEGANGWTVRTTNGFLNGTIGSIVNVPNEVASDQKNPSIAYSSDKYIVAWEYNSDVYFRMISSSLTYYSQTAVSSSGLNQQQITCAWSNGNIFLAWSSNQNMTYDIYYAVYNTTGRIGAAETVANDDLFEAQYTPAVAGGNNGQFFLVYTTYSSPLDGSGSGVLGKFFETQLYYSGIPNLKSFTWTEDTPFYFNSTGIQAVYPFYKPSLMNATVQILNPAAATFNTPSAGGITATPSSINILIGSIATINSVLNQIIITPTLNYASDYVLRLQIFDIPEVSRFTVDLNMIAIPVNDAPQWINNYFNVTEGQNVTVTNSNLAVTDVDSPLNSVQFFLASVTHGNFYIGLSTVSSFTMTQLTNGVVYFAHDGSDFAPTYSVTASDGTASSTSNGIVYFTPVNDPPVLVNNSFSIQEGSLFQITTANIGVADDSPASSITISINLPSYVQFVNSVSSAISSFTLSDIIDGDVYLQHDGSENTPSFSILVFDGQYTVGPFSATLTFQNVNDAPTLTLSAQIDIQQDQPVLLTSAMLSVTDPDSSYSSLYIEIVQATAIQVLNTANGQPITTSFSASQVDAQTVSLLQNGGSTTPVLIVRATDGSAFSTDSSFNFNFTSTIPPSVSPAASASSSPDATDGKDSSKKDSSTVIIGAAAGGGGALLAIACLAGVFLIRKKKARKEKARKEFEPENNDPETPYRAIELQQPTTPPPADSRHSKAEDPFSIDYRELEIGKELGRGAFGIVYKAQWRNGDCVVKQLDIDRSDPEAVKQFLKEAETLKHLRMHPNVCSLLGVCTDPKYPVCIVMEFLPGGSLLDYLAKGKLKVDHKVAVQLFRDISSGMSHIHQEGLLHCDLAARNLLVAPKGENHVTVKIADFGLAKETESGVYNLNSNSKFPIRWTAPEVFETGKMTKASDVWSFGVVMWEIMEQKVPYYELGNQDVAAAICNQGHRLAKPTKMECPNELYGIMMSCFARNPDERPSFSDLVHAFKALERDWEERDNPTPVMGHVDTSYSSMSGADDKKELATLGETTYEQRGNSAIYHN